MTYVAYAIPHPMGLDSVVVMQLWMSESDEMYEARYHLSWEVLASAKDGMAEVLAYILVQCRRGIHWQARKDPEFIASQVMSGVVPSEPYTPGDPQHPTWMDFRNAMDSSR